MSASERNARLDALLSATKAWGESRTKELNDRVASNKRILKGRTGAERLASASVTAASAVVADSIDDFLLSS